MQARCITYFHRPRLQTLTALFNCRANVDASDIGNFVVNETVSPYYQLCEGRCSTAAVTSVFWVKHFTLCGATLACLKLATSLKQALGLSQNQV